MRIPAREASMKVLRPYIVIFLSSSAKSCLTYFTLFLVAGMLVLIPGSSGQSIPRIPAMKQILYAPAAGLQGSQKVELAIINHSELQESATVTVYSLEGKAFTPKSITLNAGQTRRVDLRQFIDGFNTNTTLGGITVEYFAIPMVIAAQLSISGVYGEGNLDYLLEDSMESKSSTLRAVWWEPDDGSSVIMIGNSADRAVKEEIVLDGATEEVWIPAHATVVRQLSHDSGQQGPTGGRIRTARLRGDEALTGTVRATGFSASPSSKYFQTVQFFDPGVSSEAALYANGLRMSRQNRLLVQNISTAPVSVKGTLFAVNSQASQLEITARKIPAEGAVELELPAMADISLLDGAAIKLESSGDKGSIIAGFVSFDPTTQITRYAPFKDIGQHAVSTGGYPWRLDGDYESRVYITNVGRIRGAFAAVIRPEGGDEYSVDTHYLDVGETAVLDLRKIRDEQIPDRNGVTIPLPATLGNIEWSTIFGDGTQRLIGRNDVVSQKEGISNSFSCNACSCPTSTTDAWINPASPGTIVGSSTGVQALAQSSSPCGGTPWTNTITPAVWNITTPGYFTLSTGQPTSNLSGVAGGRSYFYTPFTGTYYVWNGNYCFTPPPGPPRLDPGGNGTVIQFSVTPRSYIYVGNDPQLNYANRFNVSDGSSGLPKPEGGTLSGTSSNSGDTITQSSYYFIVRTNTQSASSLDRRLTFKYEYSGASKTVSMSVTARKFGYATNTSPSNSCYLGHGYSYAYVYTVYTRPDRQPLPAASSSLEGTVVGETLSPATIACGNETKDGVLNGEAKFIDTISVCSTSEIPTCSSTHTQAISVGGFQVRQNSLTITNTGLTFTNNGPTQ